MEFLIWIRTRIRTRIRIQANSSFEYVVYTSTTAVLKMDGPPEKSYGDTMASLYLFHDDVPGWRVMAM